MLFPGFAEGVRKIWQQDAISQEFYLDSIGKETRKLPVEAFRRFNAFFVPNNEYARTFFGIACQGFQYEIYNVDGYCNMCNHIVFPFYDLLNHIVGWVNYKPFVRMEAEESGNWETNYYEYPSSAIFNKAKYIFTLPAVYEAALRDGYIIVTDGVFDTVSFVHYGLNACSVLGSQFSPWLAFYLRFIKKVFVSMDNDEAGTKLYYAVKRLIPTARRLQQTVGKDSDDLLKSEYRTSYIDAITDGIKRDMDIVFRQKFYQY